MSTLARAETCMCRLPWTSLPLSLDEGLVSTFSAYSAPVSPHSRLLVHQSSPPTREQVSSPFYLDCPPC
jgi:hypothetical protein